jgi:hypothetical protein
VYLFAIAFLFSVNSSAGVVEQSEYQKELIEEALATFNLKREEHPEGKKIDQIVIASYDVILKQDLWPNFGNLFHIVTKQDVIQRELLFKENDYWKQTLVDESARNLRVIPFSTSPMLAIALIVPTQGKTPNTVTALVVTKDLWSLRSNFAFSFVGSTLELFEVELAEFNLVGRMKKVGVNAHYDLATNQFGVVFEDGRIMGTRLATKESANLIWNRGSGQVEGGNASFTFGLPLYSLASEWGWEVAGSYSKDVYRLFSNAQLYNYSASTGELVPFTFNRRAVTARAQVNYSRGTELKHNFSLGMQAYTRRYEVPGSTLSQIAIDEFTNASVPFTEDASMFFFGYRDFKAEFMQLIGVESYAITEDYQLGHDVSLLINYANSAFGFNSNFTEIFLGGSYSWDLTDDYLTVGINSGIRFQPDSIYDSTWIKQSISLSVRNVFPRWGMFRLIGSARLTRRDLDPTRSLDFLGGNGALRGFPSNYISGTQSWGANLELRTIPMEFKSVHVGAAAFVDSGSTFSSPVNYGFLMSAGLGIRIVFPQFNRNAIRVDAGFPITQVAGVSPFSIVAQFGQAFK